MKKSLQLLLVLALFSGGAILNAQSYVDTVAFGPASKEGLTYPSEGWGIVLVGDTAAPAFPITKQFKYTAVSGDPLTPENVNVDVTIKLDGHKYDVNTGEIYKDSLMYAGITGTGDEIRLGISPEPMEGLSAGNGDVRQVNNNEVFTFVFESVNNTPPNELYPAVQMGLYGFSGWGHKLKGFDVFLNGEKVAVWFNENTKNGNMYGPFYTDFESKQEVLIVVEQGDTIQFWGNTEIETYYRLSSLLVIMEDTNPATGISLSAEGGTAEITENNGTLSILGDVLPAEASDKRINWSLENNDIGASINAGGILQAWPRDLGNGTVKVRGTVGKGESAVSGTIDVTISGQKDIPVDSIYLYPGGSGNVDSITENGGLRRIWAETYPDNAANKEVDWTVEDNGTGATIDSVGFEGGLYFCLLKALAMDNGNGTVIVKATAKDGSGVFDTIPIVIANQQTVFAEEIQITFDGEFPEIIENGGSLQMFATVLPELATDKTVTWTIDDKGTGATLDENGLLTASGKDDGNGSVTVTATANDGSGVFATLDVTIAGQTSVSVENHTLSDAIRIYPNPVNGDISVKIEVSDPSIYLKSVSVFDITGRTIMRLDNAKLSKQTTEVLLTGRSGILIMKVETSKGTIVHRIVKD